MGSVTVKAAHWSSTARMICSKDRAAIRDAILATGCTAEGLSIMMAKSMPIAIGLEKVPIKPAILIKQEAISAGGDAAYSGCVASLSCDCTDIVLLLSETVLPRFIEKLSRQPFGLRRLSERLRQMSDSLLPGRFLRARGRALPLGSRAYVMGILNVTPDSFSDGNLHFSFKDAISHAMRMIDDGADIIDIGGESTRPGADYVDAQMELSRVLEPVRYLAANTDAMISVDTMKPEVAKACLDSGAHMINDVSGLGAGPEVARLCTQYEAGLVIMHMRGNPQTMMQHTQYENLIEEVKTELLDRLLLANESGINPESVVLDPGFGFSKTAEQNLLLLKRLREFVNLGCPVLAGLSRKSIIGLIAGEKDPARRMPGSIAAMSAAIIAGADIVRVHDVAESVQAARVAFALRG